jgi:hypothetical protein
MEQALSGLGLCPHPVGLAPPWHTGLVETPRVFSGGLDSYGLVGSWNTGESDQPPSPACGPHESPCAGEHPRFPVAFRFRGEENGKSDREAAAASSQAVQYAPPDFDACSSDGESGSPSRSVSFVEPGSQSVCHAIVPREAG